MALHQCWGLLLSLLSVGAACFAGQPAAPLSVGAESAKRANDRQSRIAMAKRYRTERGYADGTYANALTVIVRWLAEQSAQGEAEGLVAEIRKLTPNHSSLKDLDKLVSDIKTPKSLEPLKQKELATRLKAAGKSRAETFRALAQRCYAANLMGYSYDLVWEMVKSDPENAIAWAAINRSKAETGWVTKFDAAQLQSGNVYIKGSGWVPKAHAERVKKGEWYEDGRWMPIAQADKLHAQMGNAWKVETENFILHSSASRKETMKVAERLEDIRQLCFRRYLEFFTRGSAKKSTELLFNQGTEKKMKVNYFGGEQEYADYIRKNSRSQNKELLLRSAGFYSHGDHASFFYYEPNFGPFQVTVMQHEVTHQILGEYAIGFAPTWLSEGVAEVLENARYDEDNRLSMPTGFDIKNVAGAAALLAKGKLPPIAEIMNLSHEAFHNADARGNNYLISGAISCFLLEHQDGIYAADFLEYVHDCYRGARVSLTDYVGMDLAALDKEFRSYLAKCEAASVERDMAYLKKQADQLAADTRKGKVDSNVKPQGKNVFDLFVEEQDNVDK